MKSWHRAVAIVLLFLTVLVAALIGIAWATLPLDGVTVTSRARRSRSPSCTGCVRWSRSASLSPW